MIFILNISLPDKLSTIFEIEYLNISLIKIIFFLLFLSFALFLYVFIRRNRKIVETKKNNKLWNICENEIYNYIFNNEQVSIPIELQRKAKKRKKNVIQQIILHAHRNLKGETVVRLQELYFKLKLDEYTIKKIRSNNWKTKAKGIREAAQLNITSTKSLIINDINNNNPILRQEARLAIIKLLGKLPYKLFNNFKFTLSEWEQFHIYEILKRKEIEIPQFSQWLNSENSSIVDFAIRMIGEYQQIEAFSMLIEILISENNPTIQKRIIETLGILENPAAIIILKKKYRSSSFESKIEIIRALGKITSNSNIKFLSKILKENDDILAMEAAYSLKKSGEMAVKELKIAALLSDKKTKSIIEHVLLDFGQK